MMVDSPAAQRNLPSSHGSTQSQQSHPYSLLGNNTCIQPPFSALLWDNIKTTGYYGTMVAGTPFGVAFTISTLALALLGCGSGNSNGCGEFITGTYKVGAVSTGFPIGFLSSAILSVPFVKIARKTRKFKRNDEITSKVQVLLDSEASTTQLYKQHVIDKIIRKADDQSWWGIRSFDSLQLIRKLNEETITDHEQLLDEKWAALSSYLNNQSDGIRVNNGKKLFNAILDVADEEAFIVNLEDDLIKAVNEKNIEELDRLIQANKDLHSYYHKNLWSGVTLLDIAINTNKPSVVEFLLENGASTTKEIHEYLEAAAKNGQKEMALVLVKFIKERHFGVRNPINIAALHNQFETLDALLDGPDAQLYAQDSCPFVYVAASNNESAVRHLVETRHLDVNVVGGANDGTYKNKTPVECADLSGHYELAEQMIANWGARDEALVRLREKLSAFIKAINHNDWKNEGSFGFFTGYPAGIDQLRKILKKWGDPQSQKIQEMSRSEVYSLAKDLQQVAGEKILEKSSRRSDRTKRLYSSLSQIFSERREGNTVVSARVS